MYSLRFKMGTHRSSNDLSRSIQTNPWVITPIGSGVKGGQVGLDLFSLLVASKTVDVLVLPESLTERISVNMGL